MKTTLVIDGKKTVRENFEALNPVMVIPCQDPRAAKLVKMFLWACEEDKQALLHVARGFSRAMPKEAS